MKLLLAIAGNAAVLWLLWRWLRAQRVVAGFRYVLVPALVLRLLAGAISVVRPTSDAQYYHYWAGLLNQQLWKEPAAWLQTLAGEEFRFAGQKLVFHGYSNTFFFLKLLSVLNLLSGGSMLLNALYLSLISFAGCWLAVQVFGRALPGTKGAAMLGLLFWPSALYWSAGITKESLLMASGAGLVAAAVALLYGTPGRPWRWALVGLVCAWLNFKMRFFYGGVLLAALLALAVVRVAQRLLGIRRRWQVLLFALTLGLGAVAAGEVSPVFRFNKFASQLTRTYSALQQKSLGRPHIALPRLAPTAESIARYTPKAVASALLRPFAWEGDSIFYGFAALENLGLLLLLALACWDLGGHPRRAALPFALGLALLTYCFVLAALLGLSTPNLGTLSRYRAPMLPMLVLVLSCQPTVAKLLRRLRLFVLR
ncbi:hypothetical protein D3Y59_05465 [Hymenobacter oligotrophus]|uniref:Glycosyltransferase RgtA/B/C/D-like domain-containing protein n=1 Tax=Hymenobacter oligotrophus TaxID=2319843 RepID=A0A3B7QZC1_9BACT|nr:hypothetical protein [Hymenobacter oligotrophus]AYA36553.1 hypothetical protein D3Y59_05465 [Hymenobacter oligotrophus]